VLNEQQDPENVAGPRASEPASGAATVAAALGDAERLVESLGPAAGQPRLRQMLSLVRRSLGNWEIRPPSPRQLVFLTRIIEDVRQETTVGSPASTASAESAALLRTA
jgi:hypothetical protein